MDEMDPGKREFMTRTAALLASLGLAAVAGEGAAAAPSESASPMPRPFPLDYPATGPMPWFKRIFHLYTGPDGLTRAEQLPLNFPTGATSVQMLRRTAERVSIGGMRGGAGYSFHVANNPTLLIPIFGSMIIELHDGTKYELQHGDLAIAEDCSGKGHISRAGPRGSFMVSVQLPKAGCPASGTSDMTSFWTDPAQPLPTPSPPPR
jgi:hypothetical protein